MLHLSGLGDNAKSPVADNLSSYEHHRNCSTSICPANPFVSAVAGRASPIAFCRLPSHVALVCLRDRKLLANGMGLSGFAVAHQAHGGARAQHHAGRALVSRRTGELRATSVAPCGACACRLHAGHHQQQRAWSAARTELARIETPGRCFVAPFASAGRAARRSRGGIYAEYSRNHDCFFSGGQRRRHLERVRT